MCHFTTDEIAAEIGKTRRQVNTVCRELFGAGGWKRLLTDEQHAKVIERFHKPGRHKSFSSPNHDSGAQIGQT